MVSKNPVKMTKQFVRELKAIEKDFEKSAKNCTKSEKTAAKDGDYESAIEARGEAESLEYAMHTVQSLRQSYEEELNATQRGVEGSEDVSQVAQ